MNDWVDLCSYIQQEASSMADPNGWVLHDFHVFTNAVKQLRDAHEREMLMIEAALTTGGSKLAIVSEVRLCLCASVSLCKGPLVKHNPQQCGATFGFGHLPFNLTFTHSHNHTLTHTPYHLYLLLC